MNIDLFLWCSRVSNMENYLIGSPDHPDQEVEESLSNKGKRNLGAIIWKIFNNILNTTGASESGTISPPPIMQGPA